MPPQTYEKLKPPAEVENNELDIDQLNAEFALLNPEQRIARAYELFGDELIAATTFGPTAPIMLDLISEPDYDIPVVNIRHGYETEDTLWHAKEYTAKFNLDVREFYAEDLEIPEEGTPEFLEFQRKIKVEPFQQMIDELRPKACLFGVMSWQTKEREN